MWQKHWAVDDLLFALTVLFDQLQDHINDNHSPRPTNASTAASQQLSE